MSDKDPNEFLRSLVTGFIIGTIISPIVIPILFVGWLILFG